MNKLPDPECEGGYPWSQIDTIFDVETVKRLEKFMAGQTMMLCEGRRYNHDTQDYREACNGVAHGGVIYPWDLQRFMDGAPIID